MTPEQVPDGPIMVDTDVVSFITLRRSEQLALWRPLLEGHHLFISFVTVAEVLQRGYIRNWGEAQLEELRRSLDNFTVVPYNAEVAEQWAAVHHKVRGHLHGEGVNDTWIAACALAVRPAVALATNNLTDFHAIAAHASLRLIHPSL